MAKFLNDSVLDSLLDNVATGTQLLINTTQPTTRANAISGALASVTLSSGDFTKADGSPNGRRLNVAQKAAVPVTATGSAAHVSIVNATDLLAVTTVTAQTLTSGNTVTIPTWYVQVSDPS